MSGARFPSEIPPEELISPGDAHRAIDFLLHGTIYYFTPCYEEWIPARQRETIPLFKPG
jgi:hypothetical protein